MSQILSLKEKVNLSECRSQGLVDVPALEHEIVEISVTAGRSRQGRRRLVMKRGQQGRVRQVLVGSDTSEVEDLPEENSKGPDV